MLLLMHRMWVLLPPLITGQHALRTRSRSRRHREKRNGPFVNMRAASTQVLHAPAWVREHASPVPEVPSSRTGGEVLTGKQVIQTGRRSSSRRRWWRWRERRRNEERRSSGVSSECSARGTHWPLHPPPSSPHSRSRRRRFHHTSITFPLLIAGHAGWVMSASGTLARWVRTDSNCACDFFLSVFLKH